MRDGVFCVLRSRRVTIARLLLPLAPILLASTAAIAQGLGAPSPAASASGTPSSASSSPAAAPPNAPILLSPGVATAPRAARAHAAATPDETRTRREWFGWQTIVVDVVVVGTSAALLRTMEVDAHLGIVLAGSALFLASGPLIHLAHGSGHVGRSLLLRGSSLAVGAVLGGLLLEGLAGCTEATPCKLARIDFAAIGAAIGAMVATVVDGTIYAWKPLPATSAYLTPTFATVRGGAVAGITVVF